MAFLDDRCRNLFPLRTVDSVIELFRWQLAGDCEPNLSLLSVVIGAIENSLTCNRATIVVGATSSDGGDQPPSDQRHSFPSLQLSTVEALCQKFQAQIRGSVDLSQFSDVFASRSLVKRVSDVVWSSLTRSNYKDRAHLQSLYSYLTGNKLDCFGVAFAVVAACQVLGFKDVHLTLSEDHAWVVFGKDGEETAEVTWHGKGNEDKRGLPITVGVAEKSWLYLNGHPVKCTRHMEVAALVSGMNPAINATTDSVELSSIQQQLLWLLYDLGHLQKYPMALGNLGDLEEISPSPGRPDCTVLFGEAIEATRNHYNNHHVYPYTYLGGYMYRHRRYKEALESWADAANVIRTYNYSREDEEIYKEFLEIANDLIPNLIKAIGSAAAAPGNNRSPDELSSSGANCCEPILDDPECFACLLRFYDGICEWEEGSSIPVLHVGWSRPLVNTISKFEASIRSKVEISVEHVTTDDDDGGGVCHQKSKVDEPLNRETNNNVVNFEAESPKTVPAISVNSNGGGSLMQVARGRRTKDGSRRSFCSRHTSDLIRSLETQINSNEAPHPNIAALAAACADNILNPEYLLGSGEPPFSCRSSSSSSSSSGFADLNSGEPPSNNAGPAESERRRRRRAPPQATTEESLLQARVNLCSEKMKGLKELLLAEKLNVSAIQLQLTAQSQVQVVRRTKSTMPGECDFVGSSCRSTKRTRRDY